MKYVEYMNLYGLKTRFSGGEGKRPVNLMHLTITLDMGGVENLVLQIMSRIDRNLFRPFVCSLTGEGIFVRELEKSGMTVYRLDKREGIDVSLPFRFSRILKQNRIQILHTHNSASFLYGVIAGKLAGVEMLVHTEHSHLTPGHFFLGKTMAFLSRYVNTIISDSHSVTRYLVHCQKIPSNKILTILNGVDIDLFAKAIPDASWLDKWGVKPGTKIIGTVGRLEEVKDHATLLTAFKKVLEVYKNAFLVIVGDGSLREELRRLTGRLNLTDHVAFPGMRRDIHRILPLFDVFVLSSKSEGLSLSILEAMAARVPVVATQVGGNAEIIQNRQTGLLVPGEDPEALSKAMMSVLSNPGAAKLLAQRAFENVQKHFSFDRLLEKYCAIYNNCHV